MPREIKFRAWDVATQIMFDPDSEDGWEISNGQLFALPNTFLMQYTGLEDKNHTPIYEGDIVQLLDGKLTQVTCVGAHFQLQPLPEEIKLYEGIPQMLYGNVPHFEVIGNIYENPELLK